MLRIYYVLQNSFKRAEWLECFTIRSWEKLRIQSITGVSTIQKCGLQQKTEWLSGTNPREDVIFKPRYERFWGVTQARIWGCPPDSPVSSSEALKVRAVKKANVIGGGWGYEATAWGGGVKPTNHCGSWLELKTRDQQLPISKPWGHGGGGGGVNSTTTTGVWIRDANKSIEVIYEDWIISHPVNHQKLSHSLIPHILGLSTCSISHNCS